MAEAKPAVGAKGEPKAMSKAVPVAQVAANKNAGKPTTKRLSPGVFVRQVRQEMRKITWPSRKETQTTALFVAIFTAIMSVFFVGVDQAFGLLVRWLVSLIG